MARADERQQPVQPGRILPLDNLTPADVYFGRGPVCAENSNPGVLVVKTAENRS